MRLAKLWSRAMVARRRSAIGATPDQTTHAIITGGSSGIGFALACLFATSGTSVSILARNAQRLDRSRKQILALAAGGAHVEAIPCDVRLEGSCRAAVEQAIDANGRPDWAVACAGIVKPGVFRTLSLDDHRAQFETNFVGSLNFSHAVVPAMIEHGGGKLIFVGSGAALIGIYGYSGYCPSKFAVRGLAEVLRVELREHGISVILAHPPDTNTPMLEYEAPLRPRPTEEIAGVAGVWEPHQVALAIIQGAKKNRFLVVPGVQLRLLSFLHSLIAPGFRVYQGWVVKRCGRRDLPLSFSSTED
jgi:3-dehydrosphinganine reductase